MIRLRGGSGPHDGYVEVQGTNPGWGIVCDSRNGWTLKEAHVVCKQLGYTRYFKFILTSYYSNFKILRIRNQYKIVLI